MAKSSKRDGNKAKVQQNPISRSSGDNVPPPGPPREPSRAEAEGVPSTDTEARSPLGVGRSTGRRGEEVVRTAGKEAGRHEAGTSGKAERPVGKSSRRDATAVNRHEPDQGDDPNHDEQP
jgi:hypothetical protein